MLKIIVGKNEYAAIGVEERLMVASGGQHMPLRDFYDHAWIPGSTIVREVTTHKKEYQHKTIPSMKVLDEDAFNNLPDSLKSSYSFNVIRNTVFESVDFDIVDIADIACSIEPFYAMSVSTLVKRMVARAIEPGESAYTRYVVDGFEVVHLAEPWDGSTELRLDKKLDGKPYKDRRGKYVNNYPPEVARTRVLATHLSPIIATSLSELDNKADAIYARLTGQDKK